MKHIVACIFSFCLSSASVLAQVTDSLPEVGTPPPPPSSAVDETDDIKVKTNKSLTDNLKENSSEDKESSLPQLPKLGIADALIDTMVGLDKKSEKSNADKNKTLSEMIALSKENGAVLKRSNASVFDISGAMLRMSPQQIDAALTKKGYKKTVQKLDIPNFIRWRNEEKCRAQGVVGYERLENCVAQMAKKDNHQFIERVFYSKYDTQEDMEIRFTSNFTKNKSYYLYYKSSVLTNLRGNSQKEFYLRNIKIFDFWKRINQKYGVPDNRESVIWGLGGNKPYLQAGTGLLRLEDPALRDLDYARMSREDKKFMSTGLYNF